MGRPSGPPSDNTFSFGEASIRGPTPALPEATRNGPRPPKVSGWGERPMMRAAGHFCCLVRPGTARRGATR